jgi:hypothetical protein
MLGSSTGSQRGLIKKDGVDIGPTLGLFSDLVEGISQDEPGIWGA